jgi:hypothetical protein
VQRAGDPDGLRVRTVSSVATMSTSAPEIISNQDAIKFLTGLDDNRFRSSRRMSTTAELKHSRPWRQRPLALCFVPRTPTPASTTKLM